MMQRVAVRQFRRLRSPGVKLQVVFLGEADRAVRLVRVQTNPRVRIARPGLGDRHFALARKILADQPGRLIGGESNPVASAGHISAFVLHRLEAADRTFELNAVLHIGNRALEHRLSAAHHLRAGQRRAALQELFE
jgi:hypothetical protein